MPKLSVIENKLYTKEWHTKPDPTTDPTDIPTEKQATAVALSRETARAHCLTTDKVIVN